MWLDLFINLKDQFIEKVTKCSSVLLLRLVIFSMNQSLFQIPTGNGLNQPIYSYHVTQASRNRVKAIRQH